jgi:tripartite-type tricarboxylate transporter receptor subunit TctC
MMRFAAIVLTLLLAAAQTAAAQSWPSRPVRIVVPFPPGGGTDVFARAIAAHLTETMKQPFIVENRTGAGGIIGTDLVAKAAPDGNTLLFGTNGPLVAVKYMSPKLPYDPLKDFTPVAMVAEVPIAIMVNAKAPINSLRDLLDQARAKPGQIAYASPGPATTGHIGGEWLKKLTGVDITHVAYRGSAPAATDLVAGQLPVAVDSLINFMPHIRSRDVRVLAVATRERFHALPDVPTARESGLDMEITLWFAFVAPAPTPRDIVTRLNREINAYVKQPAFRKLLEPHAAQPMGGSVEEAQRYLAGENERWKKMIESTGIKMN